MDSFLQCLLDNPKSEENLALCEVLTYGEDGGEYENKGCEILNFTIQSKDDTDNQIKLQNILEPLKDNQKPLKQILHLYVSKVQITDQNGNTKLVEIDDSILGHVLEKYNADVGKIFVDNITDKEIYMHRGYKDPKTKTLLGYCPLVCAALNQSSEMIRLLIDNNVITRENVDEPHINGSTLLHFACRWAPAESVRILLELGANYKAKNNDNRLPIHNAAASGNVEKMREIFKRYAKDDMENKYRDTINNKIKELKILYAKMYTHAKTNGRKQLEDEIPFHEENVEIINEECKTNWDIKIKEEAKLRVQHDLQKKFGEDCFQERDIYGNVALLLAARYYRKFNKDENRFDAIKWILDNQMKADATAKDVDGDTMLHFISPFANPDELQISLKANSLLGASNEVGYEPLQRINRDTINQMLDNNLKKLENKHANTSTELQDEYKIIFKNTLGHHTSGSDIKNIIALAQSKRHQWLALHPVCESIVSIKWQKMRKYYYFKLLILFSYVLTLSYPTILEIKYSTAVNEKKAFVRLTLYVSFALLAINVILFGTISILTWIPPLYRETKSFFFKFKWRRVSLLLRLYWKKIVLRDFCEYVLWVMAILHFFGIISKVPLVLVSWFSLFLLMSSGPMFLPFKYILGLILLRYLMFFIFAIGLIYGFVLGFYLVLRDCMNENNAPCDEGAFTGIKSTALKIFTMMMGEVSFDYVSLDLPYVYLLYTSFIFLVSWCLFNMMNGLAINITQQMMQKAHIFKTIAQCEMIFEFEGLLKKLSSLIARFNGAHIGLFSPLHVERIKASPNSGLCENFDEICVNEINKKNDPRCVFWFSSKDIKKWQWEDRGYGLHRHIIECSMAIISKAEEDFVQLADDDIDGSIKCIKGRKKAADIKYNEEEENEYSQFSHDGQNETDENSNEDESYESAGLILSFNEGNKLIQVFSQPNVHPERNIADICI